MKAHIIIYLLSHNSDSFSLKNLCFFYIQSQKTFVFSPGQKKNVPKPGSQIKSKILRKQAQYGNHGKNIHAQKTAPALVLCYRKYHAVTKTVSNSAYMDTALNKRLK